MYDQLLFTPQETKSLWDRWLVQGHSACKEDSGLNSGCMVPKTLHVLVPLAISLSIEIHLLYHCDPQITNNRSDPPEVMSESCETFVQSLPSVILPSPPEIWEAQEPFNKMLFCFSQS